MGLLCITTNIAGINEIIEHGENGSVIEPKDENALYVEKENWYNIPLLVQQMAQDARRMIVERYECHKVWDYYFNLYCSFILN